MSRTIALLVAATGLLSACSNSTQLVATWKEPGTPPYPLTHSLAVFMTKDAGMRRMVEDKLADGVLDGEHAGRGDHANSEHCCFHRRGSVKDARRTT